MKHQFLGFCFFFLLCACNNTSPSAKCQLDGRTFKIENFVNGKSDGFETLSFNNGSAENDQCKKWGFTNGVYTADANCSFRYTLTSEAEGKMDWTGAVTGNKISGTMVWIKAGQNDITYTFSGEEAKK